MVRSRAGDGHRLGLCDVGPLCLLRGDGLADDGTVRGGVLQARDFVAAFGGVEGRGEHAQRGRRVALEEGADLLALAQKRFHRATIQLITRRVES